MIGFPIFVLVSFFVVYKWNHDRVYNKNLPEDNITHVYIEKFRDFEDVQLLKEFIHSHGRKSHLFLTVHCSTSFLYYAYI
jgi:hypothetical protein